MMLCHYDGIKLTSDHLKTLTMAKVTEWRKSCPKNVLENQIRAMELDTLFVIRQNGPLAFSVHELNRNKLFEIRFGDPHRCTCKWYRIESDLCVHICWILIKKFCISVHNPISFQRGMSAQELRECLSGKWSSQKRSIPDNGSIRKNKLIAPTHKPVQKRSSNKTDTCPICLDSYSPTNPVTYCKYGCGNAVHIRCISMLVRHYEQVTRAKNDSDMSSSSKMIKCPLCRGDFNVMATLKMEIQAMRSKLRSTVKSLETHGQCCRFCKAEPIRGNLYRCLECCEVFLCSQCLTKDEFRIYHSSHYYAIKQKSDGPWRRLGKVEENLKAFNRNGNTGCSLPALRARQPPRASLSLPLPPKMSELLEFSKGFSFSCSSNNNNAGKTCANKEDPIHSDCQTINKTHVSSRNCCHDLATICGPHIRGECLKTALANDVAKFPEHDSSIPANFINWDRVPVYRRPEPKVPVHAVPAVAPSLPLELRVNRMHLEERPKEASKIAVTTPAKCELVLTCKSPRKKNDRLASNGSELSFNSQVNPLCIWMLPHLQQLIDQEKDEDSSKFHTKPPLKKIQSKSLDLSDISLPSTSYGWRSTSNLRRRQLRKIQAKSLDLPENGTNSSNPKTKSTSNQHWPQKNINRSRIAFTQSSSSAKRKCSSDPKK